MSWGRLAPASARHAETVAASRLIYRSRPAAWRGETERADRWLASFFGVEEGGPSLVYCMVVAWWLYGGCMVVLKVSSPGQGREARQELGALRHHLLRAVVVERQQQAGAHLPRERCKTCAI